MTAAIGRSPLAAVPSVEPLDQANRELLAHVRPPGWVNPPPRPVYHLVVVGAGTAGLVTAAAAAGLGAHVALVERGYMGGDCLNVGCVPSKAVIRAARAWHDAAQAQPRFGGPAAADGADFPAVMARMRRLRAGLAPVDGAPRFAALGVDVFFGDGRFVDRQSIDVDGARLPFRRAVIATGARATVPSIPGLEAAGFLTNETVFNLTRRPSHLIVLGGGAIGCELAQAFARLGSGVTVVEPASRIMASEEPEAVAIVQAAMAADGVRVRLDAAPVAVERVGDRRVLSIRQRDRVERIEGDAILVAAGRTPNVEALGLDAAGVAHDTNGVLVDDHLRTTNRRIFAAGDVCSRLRFTHLADAHARIVVRNALVASAVHMGYARASALVVPRCTYTSPALAHVGLTPSEGAARAVPLDTIVVPFREVDRAVLDGDDDGVLRLHLHRGTDRIAGATLVADHAGDLLAEITLAMTRRIGLGALGASLHAYPTESDAVRKAADTWRRTKLTPRAKRVLTWLFRLLH